MRWPYGRVGSTPSIGTKLQCCDSRRRASWPSPSSNTCRYPNRAVFVPCVSSDETRGKQHLNSGCSDGKYEPGGMQVRPTLRRRSLCGRLVLRRPPPRIGRRVANNLWLRRAKSSAIAGSNPRNAPSNILCKAPGSAASSAWAQESDRTRIRFSSTTRGSKIFWVLAFSFLCIR
jgi:hypothetical protein